MRLALTAAALACGGAAWAGEGTGVSLPPFLEDRLVYYHSFASATPEVNRAGAEPRSRVVVGEGGVRGDCLLGTKPQPLVLRSDALSPHRPLSVLFWWALAEEPTAETCFGLFHLSGRGMVSHFSRGKGQWCALEKPAGILQVWNFPGIRNVNGIYDRDWRKSVSLKKGVWHHAAMVFHGASLVEVYTDGRRAWSVRLMGRPFAAEDKVQDLVLGSRTAMPVALDEVIILRRALAAAEVRRYVAIITQMRAVRYPED
ncbi:MAG: hypothetical protein ISS72_02140 [Candidatus Brocadiae bacterium]|nr:hypothetical protein [Candidatus Brocadiia bacterium]